MSKKLSIVVGLKDNKQCRKLEESIRPIMEGMLVDGYELKDLEVTYDKSYFDDCVAAGFVNVGIMLEKFDNIAIGQGSIKAWSNLNPNIQLILVMDDMKKASAKAHGLYKREYYNGLFLSDFLSLEMMKVILHGRTKEEAYEYYGMDEYYKNRDLEEQKKASLEPAVNENIETAEMKKGNENHTGNIRTSTSLNLEDVKRRSENEKPAPEILNITSLKGDIGDIGRDTIIVQSPSDDITISKKSDTDVEYSKEINEKSESKIESTNDADVDQVDIMTLQDEEENVLSRNVSTMNDDDWTKYTSVSKKTIGNNGIVRTKVEKGNSIKKVIDALSSLDVEDDFFKNIVNEADVLIRDNEQDSIHEISDNETVSKMFSDVVSYYSYKNEVELNKALSLHDSEKSMKSFQGSVQDYIEMINEQTYHVSEADVLGEVFYLFYRFILEYDILTDLIDDESVTSIHVIDWNKIRIKKGTRRYSVKNTFISEAYYDRFVTNLKIRNAKNSLSDQLSIYFTDRMISDKFICNVSITNKYVSNTGRPEILIKKTRKERFLIKDLMKNKLSPAAAALLITAIKNGESILFVGPASCGATSLINTLLEYIPREKSGVVLEHKDEIAEVNHPELIIQHPAIVKTMSEDLDSGEKDIVTSYSVLDISNSALNLDVDYYVMVDVVGAEASAFYKAINAGFVTWGNIRANSAAGGLQRLADTIIASDSDLSRDTVCNIIANKFSLVVYMKKLRVINISSVSPDSYDSAKQVFNVEKVIEHNKK